MYGYRKIHTDLLALGEQCGKHRVLRLMQSAQIQSERGYKRKATYPGGDPATVAPNLLNRQFEVAAPNQVWVTDITYIRTSEGWLFLAVVMDLHTRKILGVALGPRLSQGLTLGALEMALREGCPEVHHSDRGVQYTSRAYVERLLGLGVRLSYAGTGRPWENGHAERLIRTIKEEWVALREYRTLAEARASVKAFVLEVYNRKRPHSALGYLTPEAFSESLLKGGGSPD